MTRYRVRTGRRRNYRRPDNEQLLCKCASRARVVRRGGGYTRTRRRPGKHCRRRRRRRESRPRKSIRLVCAGGSRLCGAQMPYEHGLVHHGQRAEDTPSVRLPRYPRAYCCRVVIVFFQRPFNTRGFSFSSLPSPPT